MADLLVSEGYAAVGYEYVNVDDCWLEKSRGSRGELVADRRRFPNGMKALGEYVREKPPIALLGQPKIQIIY